MFDKKYAMVVDSWVNDADECRSEIVEYDTLDDVRFAAKVLEIFKSQHEDKPIDFEVSNRMEDEMLTDEQLHTLTELIKSWVDEYKPSSCTIDDITDLWIDDFAHAHLGYSENWACRVFEQVSAVYYFPVKPEKLKLYLIT